MPDMNSAYNKPFRFSSELISSIDQRWPSMQLGKSVGDGVSGNADLYLPCDIRFPMMVDIQILDSTTQGLFYCSATSIAAQPRRGFHFNSNRLITHASVAAVTGIDFATNTIVDIGQLVNNASDHQYVCMQYVPATDCSHAVLASAWNAVSDHFERVQPGSNNGGFIKFTYRSPVSGSKPKIHYRIVGYER
jgi:hypothetical protein